MNTFSDIFKKGFLAETGNLTTMGFVLAMLCAFFCGMILYYIYRLFYKGVIYNNNFNILLVLTAVVTCFVVIVISSNVVLSLGMVGALSIVRFRTAIKDPLDVGFLFWAVAIGITSGAGLYLISVLATLIIAAIYIMLVQIRNRKRVYLLIVKFEPTVFTKIMEVLGNYKKVLKNRTSTKNYNEITFEIRINDQDTAFMNTLTNIEGVENATLVEFTGDYCE